MEIKIPEGIGVPGYIYILCYPLYRKRVDMVDNALELGRMRVSASTVRGCKMVDI